MRSFLRLMVFGSFALSGCDPGSAIAGQLLSPRVDAGTAPPDGGESTPTPNPILCGGAYESPCAGHKYCAFDTGCGTVGYCMPKERSCPEKQAVCGCDGQTYDSLCAAAALGVGINRAGQCSEPSAQLSCGRFQCDGKFYCLDKGPQPEGSSEERYVCAPLPEDCDSCDCEMALDRACYLGSRCEDAAGQVRVTCTAAATKSSP